MSLLYHLDLLLLSFLFPYSTPILLILTLYLPPPPFLTLPFSSDERAWDRTMHGRPGAPRGRHPAVPPRRGRGLAPAGSRFPPRVTNRANLCRALFSSKVGVRYSAISSWASVSRRSSSSAEGNGPQETGSFLFPPNRMERKVTSGES